MWSWRKKSIPLWAKYLRGRVWPKNTKENKNLNKDWNGKPMAFEIIMQFCNCHAMAFEVCHKILVSMFV